MPHHDNDPLGQLGLGQQTTYPDHYNPAVLQRVPRQLNRRPLGIADDQLPFYGADDWTAYEVSWLRPGGLPQVAIASVTIPATSPWLVESKSFKLYLNSLNNSTFDSWQQVQECLTSDLSKCAGAPAVITLMTLEQARHRGLTAMPGHCLDQQTLAITTYDYDPDLLRCQTRSVTRETLHSHLLKSNCLITNQPDWGSVWLSYEGPAIDHAALLRYLVSFRHHNEFHEQCVERIFCDIKARTQCHSLTVGARYTRRGGLDINPWRSDAPEQPNLPGRQVRQ